jgi:hypothetical protein
MGRVVGFGHGALVGGGISPVLPALVGRMQEPGGSRRTDGRVGGPYGNMDEGIFGAMFDMS